MTPHIRRRAASLAGIGFLALGLPVAAHAEDEIAIDYVEAENDAVSLVLSVDGLPAGSPIDSNGVAVEVDGRPVEAAVKTVAAGDIERSTVLVLDASNSMRANGKFDAAVSAVNSFLDAAPPDVAVGLVAFAGQVSESIPPTTDHEALRDALGLVELKPGTSVYDGILEGVDAVGTEGSRSLLVLSDGADTGSDATLAVASGSAQDAGVIVDVVSLASPKRAAELEALAKDTGGSVIPADAAALSQVFTSRADALAQQLLISFDRPPEASEEANVDVALAVDGTTFRDSAFVILGAVDEAPELVNPGEALISKPVMLLGAAALALGLAGLLGIVIVGAADGRSASERRLDAYFGSSQGKLKGRTKADRRADVKDSAIALTDKMVSADLEQRISQRLAGAGSALTVAEWILLHAGIAVGSAMVGFLLGGAGLGVLGLVAGVALPWIYLKRRHRRRLNAFNGQLAQTLGLMAGGLQAGLSLPQAVDAVVREGHQPMAGELNRALVEQRLGIDITDALEAIGDRMESADFGWVVMAIRIQREVGGNLAEILHTVAETLREREYLRRQVRALSAEGRLSGYILTALPILVAVYMFFSNGDYLGVLYTTTAGFVLLGVAVVLLSIGTFAMKKLATVEV